MKIILVGFMATGKSTVGRKLAEELNLSFFDVDREIEKVTNKSLKELYKKDGAIRFNSEEKLMLNKLLQKDDVVIATGGTLEVTSQMMNNWRKDGFKVVALWLDCDAIYIRIKRRNNRPMLQKDTMYDTIHSICNNRKNIYLKADAFIDTSDICLDEIIKKIRSIL